MPKSSLLLMRIESTPTDSVREALAKVDGLLQCWRAAKQDAQVFYVSVVL